jgi:hypothetical protein
LVVRLEPRAAPLHEPRGRVLRVDERPLPIDRRAPVRRSRHAYPDAQAALNRWFPLVKWLRAIPHYIVLFVLNVGAVFGVIAAWFAILFTGRYPRGLFGYVEGVLRWRNRVVAYAFVLVTDEYPPFRLRP